MQFGGHETFAIREGWLYKGLKMLSTEPEMLNHVHVADYLGVGRNMAKSIRHWLIATGLAERSTPDGEIRKALLQPTEFGHSVWNNDPYFMEPGTWWLLHVNLVNSPDHAASWSWFFSSFNLDRFDRAVCVESLRRHLEMTRKRQPSTNTLDRDVGCLLATYSRVIPPTSVDPEESNISPFTELSLLTHFRTSGYYQLNLAVKPIPPGVFCYAIAMAFPDCQKGRGNSDITIHDAARRPGGPGRVFAFRSESLFETALRIEEEVGGTDLQIAGLAGSRVLRIRRQPAIKWVDAFYASIEQRKTHAA